MLLSRASMRVVLSSPARSRFWVHTVPRKRSSRCLVVSSEVYSYMKSICTRYILGTNQGTYFTLKTALAELITSFMLDYEQN